MNNPTNTIDLLLQILQTPQNLGRPNYDAALLAGEALARHWSERTEDRGVEREAITATVAGLARIARDPTSPVHRARAAAALLSVGVIDLPPEEVTP